MNDGLERRMSEPKDTKKNKTIAFRLTEEEYALAESAARAAGDDTNLSLQDNAVAGFVQ